MIVVTAVMEALPGKEQEMETALKAMVPAVRSEVGTLTYVLHRAQGNPRKFFFYEVYKDGAALAHHSGTPHLAELFEKLVSLTAGEPAIELYEVLASKD